MTPLQKIIVFYVLATVALVAVFAVLIFVPKPEQRVIDCTWAEISPDFTTEMREACRKARMRKIT